jgi:hypothetical protein
MAPLLTGIFAYRTIAQGAFGGVDFFLHRNTSRISFSSFKKIICVAQLSPSALTANEPSTAN